MITNSLRQENILKCFFFPDLLFQKKKVPIRSHIGTKACYCMVPRSEEAPRAHSYDICSVTVTSSEQHTLASL